MATAKLYRAKNEVHITETPGKPGDKSKGIAPTPPKVTVIPATGKFKIDPDSDTCKELLAANAIELVKDEEEEKAPVTVSTKKAPAKKAPAKKPAAKTAAKTDSDAEKGDGDGDGDGDGSDLV